MNSCTSTTRSAPSRSAGDSCRAANRCQPTAASFDRWPQMIPAPPEPGPVSARPCRRSRAWRRPPLRQTRPAGNADSPPPVVLVAARGRLSTPAGRGNRVGDRRQAHLIVGVEASPTRSSRSVASSPMMIQSYRSARDCSAATTRASDKLGASVTARISRLRCRWVPARVTTIDVEARRVQHGRQVPEEVGITGQRGARRRNPQHP